MTDTFTDPTQNPGLMRKFWQQADAAGWEVLKVEAAAVEYRRPRLRVVLSGVSGFQDPECFLFYFDRPTRPSKSINPQWVCERVDPLSDLERLAWESKMNPKKSKGEFRIPKLSEARARAAVEEQHRALGLVLVRYLGLDGKHSQMGVYAQTISQEPERGYMRVQWHIQTLSYGPQAEAGAVRLSRREQLSDLEVLMLLSRDNPRALEVYDPREEQLRAQRQAIYESCVLKELGRRAPFRSASGRRADMDLDPETRRKLVSRCMFAMGTGVQRRDARVYPGTQRATPKVMRESALRYSRIDSLLRNRQDYEETLGLARKSGFYRVTKEPTYTGMGYFVWPMPPGAPLPIRASNEEHARAIALTLNQTQDPRQTGTWHQPARRPYVAQDLGHWLPPSAVFSATFDLERGVDQARGRRGRA